MRILAIDDPAWHEFVRASPAALPYHHPAWTQLLAECYGYRPFALTAANGDGSIAAGLPVMEVAHPMGLFGGRRWVSLPFTDYCPPLLPPGNDGEELAAELGESHRRAAVGELQVRAALPGGVFRARTAAVTHTLTLDADPHAVFKQFHRSQVQRNVAKAEKSGLVIRRAETVDDVVGTFYALHLRTRQRLGAPVQPRRLFRLLWERMIAADLGHVLLVYQGDTAVAGAVFLAWGSTVTYKYGASLEEAWHLRPNHLLFWTAIRQACERGYRAFDFGRTDVDNQGLRAFKSGWGAEETPLVYSSLGGRSGAPAGQGEGRSARLLGAVIRRGPAWVCRLAGETLYRYAA